MIEACFYKKNKNIIGIKIKNHGRDIVCSAVSILTLNTVNSIEAFTNSLFKLDYDINGGFLKFFIDTPVSCEKTELLLKSLELGLKGIESEYSEDILIKYKEV